MNLTKKAETPIGDNRINFDTESSAELDTEYIEDLLIIMICTLPSVQLYCTIATYGI